MVWTGLQIMTKPGDPSFPIRTEMGILRVPAEAGGGSEREGTGSVLESLGVLLRGVILGFVIAAPVGPIGLLCIRRTLEHGPARGFATGLGAALADTFYGAVAAFGMQVVIDWLSGHQTAFRLFGGTFMLLVALRGLMARPIAATADHAPDPPGMVGNFVTGFLLTISNPLTIFAFFGAFAIFGLGDDARRLDEATLVVGVFLGASLWWLLLNAGIAAVRHRINDGLFVLINRTAAALLAACGLYALCSGLLALGGA